MKTPYDEEAGEEKAESGKITFALPDGLDLEGQEEGGTIEVVAELEIEEGGKLCLKKINGIEVAGNKPKPKPARSFAEAVTGETDED